MSVGPRMGQGGGVDPNTALLYTEHSKAHWCVPMEINVKYALVRNAKVEVSDSRNKKNQVVANITVNGKYNHIFPATSRVSRSLETMHASDLRDRLMGGTFFFVDDILVDYRDGFYNGFIQDDASIAALVRVIGIQKSETLKVSLHDNLITHRFVLGCRWNACQIVIPECTNNSNFSNELLFSWSPFNKDINSAFVLVHETTGTYIRGMSSTLRKRIPLVNRWEEHLDIACRQLETRIDSEIKRRFAIMVKHRASIQELQLISDHANTRLKGVPTIKGSLAEQTLQRIYHASNPVLHLNKVYQSQVFTDMRLAAQRAGHLTVFDAYLLASDIRTNSVECEGSSTLALDRFCNDLIFNRDDLTQYGTRYENTQGNVFKSVEHAFLGLSR
jgi:hypothetical protein